MTPAEIQEYLKTKEYETGAVIQRNTDLVQHKYPCMWTFVFIRTGLFDT